MADTILITMDDLETAVRVNATFEANGECHWDAAAHVAEHH